MSRWLIFIALLIVIGIASGVLLTYAQALVAPEQPITYSHQTHVKAGVQCLFCHTSALRSTVAGIPSIQKCMGCHSVIATGQPEIKKVTGYWERGGPIPWVRVNIQPDFVFFSHQSHLGAGLNCETCHGDVGNMTVDRPVVKMGMDWCLDCHLKQSEANIARLTDCLTCHK